MCVCVRPIVSVFFLHESPGPSTRRENGYFVIWLSYSGYLAGITHNGVIIGVMRYVHVA